MKVCIVLRTNRKAFFCYSGSRIFSSLLLARFFRSSHPEVFYRDFLKIFKIRREAPVLECLLVNVTWPTGCNVIKERLRCKFLPVIFAKISRMSSSPELLQVTASELLLPR